MPSYATEADAVGLYGTDYIAVATDRTNTGAIDSGLLQRMLDRATSLINGKLADRVPLPLDPVPDDIVGYCVDLAVYWASVTCDSMTEQKATLFEQATKALEYMAKNMTSLGVESPPLNVSADAEISTDARVFGRESLGKIL